MQYWILFIFLTPRRTLFARFVGKIFESKFEQRVDVKCLAKWLTLVSNVKWSLRGKGTHIPSGSPINLVATPSKYNLGTIAYTTYDVPWICVFERHNRRRPFKFYISWFCSIKNNKSKIRNLTKVCRIKNHSSSKHLDMVWSGWIIIGKHVDRDIVLLKTEQLF